MTNNERIGYDGRVYSVTFTHEECGFRPDPESAMKEELRIEYNGLVYYTAERMFSGEVTTEGRFWAKPETVVKMFDKIEAIRQNGEMKSSPIALDARMYTIDVDYNGENVVTVGSFSFPEWSVPILRSVRMLFINYGQGFRPGLLFNID